MRIIRSIGKKNIIFNQNSKYQIAVHTRRSIEMARSRVRYGYKRIHVLLKRESIQVTHKRGG